MKNIITYSKAILFGILLIIYNHAYASQSSANNIAVDNLLRIIAGGTSTNTSTGQASGVIARYLPLGTLDITFGSGLNGVVTTSLGINTQINDIALQSNNTIIAAGQIISIRGNPSLASLIRYTTSGTLDTTFGTNGSISIPLIDGINGSTFYCVQLQSNGQPVAAGAIVLNGIPMFLLARFNTNGTLDTTFGTNGIVTTQVGSNAVLSSLAIQSNGSIVAVGTAQAGSASQLAIARYTSTGQLDTTFGTNGITLTSVSGSIFASLNSVALQSNGSIVAAGINQLINSSNFIVVRYTSNGILDTAFNTTGIVQTTVGTYAGANALLIQNDGNIVVTGYSDTAFATARYTTSGALDAAFGTNGIVTTQIQTADMANAIALQLGTSLLGGIMALGSTGLIVAGQSDSNFGLTRYLINGITDVTFGPGGTVTQP